nr:MAG TPA: tail protein [Caudoviricetes sp.]
MSSILPSANSPLQHALAALTDETDARLNAAVIGQVRDPATCPAEWLPWLAWANSVGLDEGWDFAETEQAKRRLIAEYVTLHAHKGTPYIVRKLFRDLDLGEIDIVENAAALRWNGTAQFNGVYQYGGGEGDWAKYGIVLKRVISNAQAAVLRRILGRIAPLRCELIFMDFRSEAFKWDGTLVFDGTYNFGAA